MTYPSRICIKSPLNSSKFNLPNCNYSFSDSPLILKVFTTRGTNTYTKHLVNHVPRFLKFFIFPFRKFEKPVNKVRLPINFSVKWIDRILTKNQWTTRLCRSIPLIKSNIKWILDYNLCFLKDILIN